ncbi:hypothetical protein P5609_012575 [Bacillus licheniformis]|uniref:hypothetical protein n=1 Tax=Bacillus licheniformis TaxID=1402 RepID=UPI00018C8D67|nr:hypothetical protein [Bacillus licheniformis]MBW7632566.1 hypothetical protein [Bacillus licheniformis]MDH3163825.1 hypothetical protein [Bacillus licheniformis]MED4409618.1 hypothetical protein [Bacillus licheniformis]QDL80049.1 hypothetical protein D9Y32_22830 [Bacillus licheniformis]
MSKVIIYVHGGVPYIEENDTNTSVMIIDWDNEDQQSSLADREENSVIVEVFGGVAECTHKGKGIDVEIIDFDNLTN